MARNFGLSKSKLTAFEQCPKRLWLATHCRELAVYDDGAEARFATGHEIGAIACTLVPDGVMVEAEPSLTDAITTTQQLLQQDPPKPIFEATLEHDGVLVRVDVLEPDGQGGWHMAEVKSTTHPKDYHHGDLATQIWVARQAGVAVSSAAIRHIDSSFVLQREGDYAGLLTDSDLMGAVESIVDDRRNLIVSARTTLAGPEPATAPGPQCDSPFPCEFAAHCHAALPPAPDWPVTVLPHGGGKRWLEQGVVDLLDVDPETLTNPTHQKVFKATTTGEVFHDDVGARAAMADWAYPRIYLDFETIAFAAPRWVGTRPYQQVPFQFSAHIESASGDLAHREFLSLNGSDPRRTCAEALVAMIPDTGAIIAYNAPFERRCIVELADSFPDLAPALNAMASRLVDLLPVTRACWYHRDQRGSWSIKAVLPTVAPQLDYSDLAVKDGGNAQQAYLEATLADTSPERRQELDLALRAYCGRDTEAMIVLAKHLASA